HVNIVFEMPINFIGIQLLQLFTLANRKHAYLEEQPWSPRPKDICCLIFLNNVTLFDDFFLLLFKYKLFTFMCKSNYVQVNPSYAKTMSPLNSSCASSTNC